MGSLTVGQAQANIEAGMATAPREPNPWDQPAQHRMNVCEWIDACNAKKVHAYDAMPSRIMPAPSKVRGYLVWQVGFSKDMLKDTPTAAVSRDAFAALLDQIHVWMTTGGAGVPLLGVRAARFGLTANWKDVKKADVKGIIERASKAAHVMTAAWCLTIRQQPSRGNAADYAGERNWLSFRKAWMGNTIDGLVKLGVPFPSAIKDRSVSLVKSRPDAWMPEMEGRDLCTWVWGRSTARSVWTLDDKERERVLSLM